jgi:dTDP-4-dehydrorhamnose 3,5-epimerase
MELKALGIEGAWLADSPVWHDNRGHFREWFKREEILKMTGRHFEIEQANVSVSRKGSLRGIHYSNAPKGQAKWITCVAGSIRDVIVDIRPESKSFGHWIEVELSGSSGQAVFIGERLGHGFVALEDNTAVVYLVSTPFSPSDEFEINPLDEEIGIDWGMDPDSLKISEKDIKGRTLQSLLKLGLLPKLAQNG